MTTTNASNTTATSSTSTTFRSELEALLNTHSVEGVSNSPDYVQAQFLVASLDAFNGAVNGRERYYGRDGGSGGSLNGTSPSEALFAFVAWLTCRDQAVTFGARHDAAPAADLVAAFCASQGFAEPTEGWEKQLRPYPSSGISPSPDVRETGALSHDDKVAARCPELGSP